MEYAQVDRSLFLGSHPETFEDIEVLRQILRVTAVVNLETDDDMLDAGLDWRTLEAHYGLIGIAVNRIPVRDSDLSALAAVLPRCVSTLRALLTAGDAVFLHCRWGLGRSPTVAIAYLHHCLGWTLEAATAHLQRRRECKPCLEAIHRASWPSWDILGC